MGNIQQIDNLLNSFTDKIENYTVRLENEKLQMKNAEEGVKKDFAKDNELKEKAARLAELNIILSMDEEAHAHEEESIEPEPQH